jgi:hypothetical protein
MVPPCLDAFRSWLTGLGGVFSSSTPRREGLYGAGGAPDAGWHGDSRGRQDGFRTVSRLITGAAKAAPNTATRVHHAECSQRLETWAAPSSVASLLCRLQAGCQLVGRSLRPWARRQSCIFAQNTQTIQRIVDGLYLFGCASVV